MNRTEGNSERTIGVEKIISKEEVNNQNEKNIYIYKRKRNGNVFPNGFYFKKSISCYLV